MVHHVLARLLEQPIRLNGDVFPVQEVVIDDTDMDDTKLEKPATQYPMSETQ